MIEPHGPVYLTVLDAWAAGQTISFDPTLQYDGPPALILGTSGTTSAVKPVVIPWSAVAARCQRIAERLGRDNLAVSMAIATNHHTFGLITAQLAPAYAGCEVVVLPPGGVRTHFEAIEKRSVTCLFLSALHCLGLVNQGKLPNCRSIKLVVITGNLISVDDHKRIESAFGCPVLNLYGTSETGAISCGSGAASENFGAPYLDVRIVDGLIEVGGPTLASAYIGGDIPVVDGWYRTGDRGEIMDGELRLYGRKLNEFPKKLQ